MVDADTYEAALRLANVTDEVAASDWAELLARRIPTRGSRQVRFTASEVVLCLAAMFVVPYNKYGSASMHAAPSPVPQLAALFKRPRSSVVAKMANLAGARRHAARGEREAAVLMLADGGAKLLAGYRKILLAARAAGVGENELPDFLPVKPYVSGGSVPGF